MLFGTKRQKELAEQLSLRPPGQSYRDLVRQRFRRSATARWSLRLLQILVFVALLADFLANEKPLYCRLDGEVYFPVARQYLVDLGLTTWDAAFVNTDWDDHDYEQVIWPPIPYSAHTIDRRNMDYAGPFDRQNVPSVRFRHWLGTDQIGRDVAAGMISGARTAILVGLVAMSIATLIGVFLGTLAGFFGDDRLKVSRIRLLLNVGGLALGLFYGFNVRGYAIAQGPFGWELVKSIGVVLAFLLVANGLAGLLKRIAFFHKKVTLPMDILVMRLIEIMNSIPTLLLILSVVAVIEQPNILYVMVIIGLVGWTGVARFTRAEMLRIRRLEYMEAAHALGLSRWRIIRRHALPNALTPVLITIAFGIAGAILLEAYLSFLSVGVAPDQVTWGSLLNLARSRFSAWWLAIFPGLAIFVTVTLFNLLGESLTSALGGEMGIRHKA